MTTTRNLFPLLLTALALPALATPAPTIPGSYTLTEVNGRALPTTTWDVPPDERGCRAEVVGGTLLLSSDGKWVALVEEREVCPGDDGVPVAGESTWALLDGPYEVAGDSLTLHFLGTSSTARVPVAGGDLILRERGVGRYEGQSLELVLRRR